jgi:hypothetical protein
MTLRCPKDIENYDGNRLAECPKSNKILIISEACKTREDLDKSYHLFGLHTAISMVTSSYYQAKFFYDKIRFSRGDPILDDVEFVFEKSIRTALNKFEENPYAIVFMGHGDFHSIQDGTGEWITDFDIANLLNNLKGDLFFFLLPVCHSKQFGDNLLEYTDKIIALDARYSDKPSEGKEYFDGNDDASRATLSLDTWSRWNEDINHHIIEYIFDNHGEEFQNGLKKTFQERRSVN